MIELVVAEIDEPDAGTEWRAAIRARAMSAHDVLLRHPWSSLQWAARTSIGPARMHHLDAMLRDLRTAGLSPGLLDVAFHALQNHIVGHALQHAAFPFDADDLPGMSARILETFPAEAHPDLAAHIRYHLDTPDGGVSSFEFGLDALLDALERARDEA
jgi:hypothetical protein